eukprot:TRINITY_DN51471_c0_g1_i1.p2 TRINITY_DN51471_c0_g1~~TRINITY_DN51471_c0_g1_i1.p2  ORF type:complete len:115 (-),score=14.83 TRINITY_DN51471_c0_g1_i1:37-381(-)
MRPASSPTISAVPVVSGVGWRFQTTNCVGIESTTALHRHWWVSQAHIFTVQSSEAVAIQCPSRDAEHRTPPTCPSITWMTSSRDKSKNRVTQSLQPVNNTFPIKVQDNKGHGNL